MQPAWAHNADFIGVLSRRFRWSWGVRDGHVERLELYGSGAGAIFLPHAPDQ